MEFDLSPKVSCKHKAAFLKCLRPFDVNAVCHANIPLLFTGALSVLNYVSFLCVRSEFHLRSLAEKKSLLHFRKVCIETINILKVLLCPFVTFRCRNSVMDS